MGKHNHEAKKPKAIDQGARNKAIQRASKGGTLSIIFHFPYISIHVGGCYTVDYNNEEDPRAYLISMELLRAMSDLRFCSHTSYEEYVNLVKNAIESFDKIDISDCLVRKLDATIDLRWFDTEKSQLGFNNFKNTRKFSEVIKNGLGIDDNKVYIEMYGPAHQLGLHFNAYSNKGW